jgi:hypothetical protein
LTAAAVASTGLEGRVSGTYNMSSVNKYENNINSIVRYDYNINYIYNTVYIYRTLSPRSCSAVEGPAAWSSAVASLSASTSSLLALGLLADVSATPTYKY